MPPRVPGFTIVDVLRAFRNDGWTISRGSRHTKAIYEGNKGRQDGVYTTTPWYGRDIPPNAMGGIIVPAGWTVSELRNLARGRNRSRNR